MIKVNTGRVVYQPLEFVFNVVEKGGSATQKVDSSTGEFVPNRALTPYVLAPTLNVTDPDGYISSGDVTSQMANVTWTADGVVVKSKTAIIAAGESVTNYDFYSDGTTLYVRKNIGEAESVALHFEGSYYDARRADSHKFKWDKVLTSTSTTTFALSMATDNPTSVLFDVFAMADTHTITAQLRNGSTDLADSQCVYKWQVFDTTLNDYRDIEDTDLWCLSGKDTKSITVSPKMVEMLNIRCTGKLNQVASDNTYTQYCYHELRRWYGQYKDKAVITQGAHVTPSTTAVVQEVTITRRDGGNVASPLKYFDIRQYFRRKSTDTWECVSNNTVATVPRAKLGQFSVVTAGAGYDAQGYQLGYELSELTAVLPLAMNGKLLSFKGAIIVGQSKK